MFDLHWHSTFSDGDVSPAEIVRTAVKHGLRGISLTDHNGVWGVEEARRESERQGLQFLEGIEISAQLADADVHVLGYSDSFDQSALESGLAATRRGYRERLGQMVELCQQAGYEEISFSDIEALRAHIQQPAYISYDLLRVLRDRMGISYEEAKRMTTTGGTCWIPYGDWAMTPAQAVTLIHQAGGAAALAHPGILRQELSPQVFGEVIDSMVAAGLDGLEVFHPYHGEAVRQELHGLAERHRLTVTGGSDWHGPGRYTESDAALGKIGVSDEEYGRLTERLRS